MHVAILGLGPSLGQFLEVSKRRGGRHKVADEIWGINALGDVFRCDRIFHMDDVRVQEARAKAQPDSNIAAMLEWMKKTDVPIVTSRVHPDYPTLEPFPLEDVLNEFGFAYFNNTAAYAMAYAIHREVSHISVYGCDYTYPNSNHAEAGRGCLEFWMGQAGARGIKFTLPFTTSLMDSCMTQEARLYGYDTLEVVFNVQQDGSVKLDFKEKELPSAEEIESRYDHSAHPNPLVRKENDRV